jgi:hypothetical protein
MITKTRTRKSDLFELFDLDKLPKSSDIMKQKLIAMAKNGKPRPSQKTKEGKALGKYTNKSSVSYCPKFDKTIRKLIPDWFISTSKIMKKKLIAIAKSGAKKPSHRTKEAQALYNYTRKSSVVYCQKFDKTIRKLRPDWFVFTSQIMRQKLIAMAKSGAKKPNYVTKEGRCLYNYTKKYSGAYCQKFDKTIRKLRPDWFVKSSDNMKQNLISMAKSGAKRPGKKTKEGRCLISYTIKSGSCYCPIFNKTVRNLAPFWFRKIASYFLYDTI